MSPREVGGIESGTSRNVIGTGRDYSELITGRPVAYVPGGSKDVIVILAKVQWSEYMGEIAQLAGFSEQCEPLLPVF